MRGQTASDYLHCGIHNSVCPDECVVSLAYSKAFFVHRLLFYSIELYLENVWLFTFLCTQIATPILCDTCTDMNKIWFLCATTVGAIVVSSWGFVVFLQTRHLMLLTAFQREIQCEIRVEACSYKWLVGSRTFTINNFSHNTINICSSLSLGSRNMVVLALWDLRFWALGMMWWWVVLDLSESHSA